MPLLFGENVHVTYSPIALDVLTANNQDNCTSKISRKHKQADTKIQSISHAVQTAIAAASGRWQTLPQCGQCGCCTKAARATSHAPELHTDVVGNSNCMAGEGALLLPVADGQAVEHLGCYFTMNILGAGVLVTHV
jgi:hypothetical protein